MAYVALAGMMLVTLLGSWGAPWIVNRGYELCDGEACGSRDCSFGTLGSAFPTGRWSLVAPHRQCRTVRGRSDAEG